MEASNVYKFVPSLARVTKEFIDETGISIKEIAHAMKFDRSYLSKYLNGNHSGDVSEIEARLEKFLLERGVSLNQQAEHSALRQQKPSFYETADASSIIGVCSSCQQYMGLGLVIGKSGYGKSHTLKHFSKMPKVAYIECDDTMSSRDLVEAIEKVLGIPSTYGTIWKRVNGIKEFFSVNRGYLLIVDEADKLINKYTQKKMEILRSIYDHADVGLVIAGEPKLESQIKGYLIRFANRIDFYYSLRGLTQKEVHGYLKPFPFTEDALQEMLHRANNNQTGCFRLLDRTLNNVIRLVDGPEEITMDVIGKASNMMML